MIELTDLDQQLSAAFETFQVKQEDQTALRAFLNVLLEKNPITALHGAHSIRVGLKASQIAAFLNYDARALLFAGLTHDLGKCQVPIEVLGKTDSWTADDAQQMQSHPLDGYRLLRGRFDFTAETMILHHRFQSNGYPKELPPPLHHYSQETSLKIVRHGQITAWADVYDALHRENSKFGEKRRLSDSEIREQMLIHNHDEIKSIEDLYSAGIFS